MILDTTFFLDLIQEDQKAISQAEWMEANTIPERIPAQVVYELYVGGGYSDDPESETRHLDGVLRSRPIVDTTESIAKLAGRMDGQLRKAGDRVSPSDLIIGAIGISFDEPILTRNVNDFERMPAVAVETY